MFGHFLQESSVEHYTGFLSFSHQLLAQLKKKKAGRLRKALQLFSYTYIWSLQHYLGYVYKIFLDSNVPSNCTFTDGIYRNKSQNSPWEGNTFFPPKINFLLSKIIFIVTSYLNTKWYTCSKVICILHNQFRKYFINVAYSKIIKSNNGSKCAKREGQKKRVHNVYSEIRLNEFSGSCT